MKRIAPLIIALLLVNITAVGQELEYSSDSPSDIKLTEKADRPEANEQ